MQPSTRAGRGRLRRGRGRRSAPSSSAAATSPCCARAIRCSTARSASSSSGWPVLSDRGRAGRRLDHGRRGGGRAAPLVRATRPSPSCPATLPEDAAARAPRPDRRRRDPQDRPPPREGPRGALDELRCSTARSTSSRSARPTSASMPLADVDRRDAPYFSLILVRRRGRAADERRAGDRACSGRRGLAAAARISRRCCPAAELHAPRGERVPRARSAYRRARRSSARAVRGRPADRRPVRRRHPDPRRWRRCSPTSAPSRRWWRSPRTAAWRCRCSAAIAAPTGWPAPSPRRSAALAAITTAGDVRFGLALDDSARRLARRQPGGGESGHGGAARRRAGRAAVEAGGGRLADRRPARPFAATATRGAGHRPRRAAGSRRPAGAPPAGAGAGRRLRARRAGRGAWSLVASRRCARRTASPPARSPASPRSTSRRTSRPIHALAAHLGVPARFFPAARLEAESAAARQSVRGRVPRRRLPRRRRGRRARGGRAGGRAGRRQDASRARAPARRAGAGADRPGARRPAARHGSRRRHRPGRRRAGARRRPSALLADGRRVVGYRVYLDLVADLLGAASALHASLSARRRALPLALDLAAAGRRVALVSSGDAGIYAMAPLVFELLERGRGPAWQRIAMTSCPACRRCRRPPPAPARRSATTSARSRCPTC